MAEIEYQAESRIQDGCAVLRVTGDVDLFTAPQMREALQQMVAQGQRRLVIDLSGVGFLDSTGLGVMVGVLKRVREVGGDLVLVGPQRPVRRVLAVTGLDKIFAVYTDVDEVVGPGTHRGVPNVGDATATGRTRR